MRTEIPPDFIKLKLGKICIGDEVLVRHPAVGSLWITVTGFFGGAPLVEGWYWDVSDGGSWIPEGYWVKEYVNFPLSCVFKIRDNIQ